MLLTKQQLFWAELFLAVLSLFSLCGQIYLIYRGLGLYLMLWIIIAFYLSGYFQPNAIQILKKVPFRSMSTEGIVVWAIGIYAQVMIKPFVILIICFGKIYKRIVRVIK